MCHGRHLSPTHSCCCQLHVEVCLRLVICCCTWGSNQPCTCYSFPLSYLFLSVPSLCVGMSSCVTSNLAYGEYSSLRSFYTVSRIPRRGLISPLHWIACPDWERETEPLSVYSSQPSVQLVWALRAQFFSQTFCSVFFNVHIRSF